MLRYIWVNVKNSVRNKYFLLGILLMLGAFFFCTGQGGLSRQLQIKPLLIQELFRYSKEEMESNIWGYNNVAIFEYGLRQIMHLVMPLTGVGFLLRFCDERYGGYDRMILARIGKNRYLIGTLMTSAVLSVLTVIISCISIVAIVWWRCPSAELAGELADSGVGIIPCLSMIASVAILSVIGGWCGFLIAVISESRFLSLILPVMIYEVWVQFCRGSKTIIYNMSPNNLVNPFAHGLSLWGYFVLMISLIIIVGSGYYLIAVKKFEKGR